MERIGLVLAGGGGKGAYQIGVWKFLKECGLDNYICAVSGTSVGALNAALFCAGDYVSAEDIWLNIAPNQILTPKKITKDDIIRVLVQMGIKRRVPMIMVGGAMIPFMTLVNALSAGLTKRYGFSRDGLLDIMNKKVDFGSISISKIPCYATCFQISGLKPKRFDLREYMKEDMEDILLASSAIPIVFDAQRVLGDYYYDGGLPLIGDNVPIEPIYDMGVENIIVVHLRSDSYIDREKYKNTRLIEIVPQVDLGGPINGTLDFTSEGSSWRIQQGFEDAKRIFGPFVEIAKLGKKNQYLFKAFQESENRYREAKRELNREYDEIQSQKEIDGFSEMCKTLGIN